MAKVTQDVLTRILQDRECDALLHEALVKDLRENPLKFYMDFVAPRSGKLQDVNVNIAGLTPVQEVAEMNKLSSPTEKTVTSRKCASINRAQWKDENDPT